MHIGSQFVLSSSEYIGNPLILHEFSSFTLTEHKIPTVLEKFIKTFTLKDSFVFSQIMFTCSNYLRKGFVLHLWNRIIQPTIINIGTAVSIFLIDIFLTNINSQTLIHIKHFEHGFPRMLFQFMNLLTE